MTPFVDLHLHLDGAITVEIARKLAALQGIALPGEAELPAALSVPADCRSLNDFLACFALPLTLLQTPEGLEEAVCLVAEHIRSQGVVYGEIRFAPQLHTQRGMTQEDAVLAALRGLRRSRLLGGLILCCMRGVDTLAANRETVELAKAYLVETGGVVALDLAGAEALYPTGDYRALFAAAGAVPLTIHAGEAAGSDSVRAAIDMGARRIGHGVRCAGDEAVLALLGERGITLELCPTSNRQTRAVADMRRYPLGDFLDRGVRVTLNTDDMAISRTTLAAEFQYAKQLCSLTAAQERTLLSNAVEAAFTDAPTRVRLRQLLAAIK